MEIPPEILMGEAGTCSLWALIAVAWVFQRNQHMNGWQEKVSDDAILASQMWNMVDDISGGAQFVFSTNDLERKEVKDIVSRAGPVKVKFECEEGSLWFY